jgi:hypothetical protein
LIVVSVSSFFGMGFFEPLRLGAVKYWRVVVIPMVPAILAIYVAGETVSGTTHSIVAALTLQVDAWQSHYIASALLMLLAALLGLGIGFILRPKVLAKLRPNNAVEKDAQ